MGNILNPFPEPIAVEETLRIGLYISMHIKVGCQEKSKEVHPGLI